MTYFTTIILLESHADADGFDIDKSLVDPPCRRKHTVVVDDFGTNVRQTGRAPGIKALGCDATHRRFTDATNIAAPTKGIATKDNTR
ncbi:hypothetical protein FAVG1_11012 [Fusarium avenaceum]|nr:hypothetical protein FAVG1_11012 [Fusarium avenaceum]